jgi:capsular polysaccharide biosynthesis protein
LHESGFEGFENAVPDSKPIAPVDSTGKKSVPAKLDDTDDSKPMEGTAKTVSKPSVPSTPKPPITPHATKLINASNVTKPINSKQILATKSSNKDVVAHSPNTGTLNPSIA